MHRLLFALFPSQSHSRLHPPLHPSEPLAATSKLGSKKLSFRVDCVLDPGFQGHTRRECGQRVRSARQEHAALKGDVFTAKLGRSENSALENLGTRRNQRQRTRGPHMTKELAATSRVSLYLPLERKTRKPQQMQFKAEMPGRNRCFQP